MTARHIIDKNTGAYLGAFDGWTDKDGAVHYPAIPENGVDVVSPPSHGKDTWNGVRWIPDPALQPTYREKRKAAYIAELGQKPDFIETVGDVLDDLIREVRALSSQPATPEFATLVAKVDAIKARFPKD